MILKLKITGMHCVSCAMNIDFDLEDVEGVISSKTSYAKGITEVEFDNKKLTIDVIKKAIEETGYRGEIFTEGGEL